MPAFLPKLPLKRIFFGLIICLTLTPGLLRGQGGGCVCTNCPQFMPDLFVGPFFISVQNAANPILGQNGQGVCAVIVHFDHTAICDISITLTSPSGQTITLVGPIGQFCSTNGNAGTVWDVTFLPCNATANPDPGFSATWDNNQNWGANNNYNGSYYPFAGCLENFIGPVNGTWTLTVTDGQANDVGNLIDYEIIFCDPTGINCFSCVANAGNLLQSDVVACQGDPILNLDLPATYAPPTMPPPAAEYGYKYVIGGAGGVILAFEDAPDLSAYPAGNYTVCGMSYLLAQEGNIPAPNGMLTITQLTTQLNSTTPPFCGKITGNCVNVTIKPLPPNEDVSETICAPACFTFHGITYCQTGVYTQTLFQNGCPYTATLDLTVNQPTFRTIVETICPDGCSITPGFPSACGAGQYVEAFTNAAGCDSIVTLNLVNMNVVAKITPNPPPPLSCQQPSAQLSALGSTLGAGVTYLWSASNGGVISGPTNTLNITATAAGNYHLQVCKTQGLITCCDTTSVTVTGSQTLPSLPAGIIGDTVLCSGQTTSFSVPLDTGAVSYIWTVPADVTISAGMNNDTISLIWGDTSGVICVAAVNACGAGPPRCQTISVTTLSDPAPPQGIAVVCAGDTLSYSITPVAGATKYLWSVPAPATILGNQDSSTVFVLWAAGASGNICVAASNACDTSQSSCIPVQVNTVPGLPDIAGDSSLCAGATGVYSMPVLANATGYNWTVPPGGMILSGQDSTNISVSWGAAPGGNVCVVAGNGCGTGPQDCFPVTVFVVPVANAGADNAVCAVSDTLSAIPSVPGSAGMWITLAGPGLVNFTDANASVTAVSVNPNGVYTFLWTETNGLCTDSDTVVVQFNASPQTGIVLSDCDATNQNYTITFPIVGGAGPYSVPGGTVANDTFVSASIPSGLAYSFVVTDANGCLSPALGGLVNCNCATDAGQMGALLLTACPGNTVTAQQQGGNLDGDDIGAYILHTVSGPTLGVVLAENTNGVFGFGAGMSYDTTYYISYVVGNNVNGQPDLNDPCLSVAAGQPVIFYDNPVANAGADVAGCTLTLPLTGNPVAGTRTWSLIGLPAGGTATIANPNQASTNLSATGYGTYILQYAITDVHGCMAADTVQATFQASPAAGAPVTVCDGTNQVYTVSFPISGGAAPYQVNGIPVAGSTYLSAQIASGGGFNFVVSDANGCVSPAVVGSVTCSCATDAGQMGATTVSACENDVVSATHLGGQNLDANDALAFVLHTGSGPNLGMVLAQNTSGVFSYLPGMNFGTPYYVSVVAGNNLNGWPDPSDPCFSVAQGQPVVYYENPVPDAGPNSAICGLTTALAAVNSGFAGQWTQVAGPGVANFSNANAPGTGVTVGGAGDYTFRWTETNSICSAYDEVTIRFNPVPAISGVTETCNGTNTGFVLNFTVNGGTAPYTVAGVGGTFAGNVFTSPVLPNNSSYTATLTDANGCTASPVSGTHFCPCTTDAGTMVTGPAVFCADQPASAIWNNNATLDANDTLLFVLRTSGGVILATNNQPVFPFGAGLQTGVTYYISAVAGNNLSGQVDPSDPCRDIASGAPVQWKPLPTATLTGDATICRGGSATLQFAGTGTYPLTVGYTTGGGGPATLILQGSQPVNLPVSPTATTTFTLVSVTDGTLPACTRTLGGSVTVTVNTPVTAGTAAAPVEFCAGTTQTVQLANLLTGADPGGQWTETSAKPSSPGAFQAAAGTFQTNGQPAGTYTFRYSVQAAAPCPGQSTTVTVILHALPTADAGPDITITCSQPTVTLGGPGTGPGMYNWTLQGAPAGNTAQINVSAGGVYTLVVTNTAGCTAGDNATVAVDNATPVAHRVTVQPVSCFGDRDGSIVLDSITSNHPPVLFSLNGGPFLQQSTFSGLAPGTYTVTLQDANGCEWTTGSLIVAQPVPMTVDLGPAVQINLGELVVLNAETTVPFSALQSVVWSPVWDTLHADTLIQSFLPVQSGQVSIHVVDTNGCSANTTVLILVDRIRRVYIPNAIRPESLENDRLVIFGGKDVEMVESFRIYDRWGEQVFEAREFLPNDLSVGWDGTYRGTPVNPGVYAYYAVLRFVDGKSEIFQGDVTVLR